MKTTRREFLAQVGATAAASALPAGSLFAGNNDQPESRSRVVIARDEALSKGQPAEHAELIKKLLDASLQKLTGAADATAAWRKFVSPKDRVGIKVNTLGFPTQPAVADAIAAGVRQAGVPAENIIIWDRFDSELTHAGFKLNKSGSGVQCRGTNTEDYSSGYQDKLETAGGVESRFSRILAEQVDVVIGVPVLKDHHMSGVTLAMKNFYGVINNPDKYHANGCDPFIVDVISHPLISKKWRLTVLDGVKAQYHGGPGRHPGSAWAYGGLLVATDFVALDAVGADLLAGRRKERGLKSFEEENRPARHIATAAARGLGQADLKKIERVEV